MKTSTKWMIGIAAALVKWVGGMAALPNMALSLIEAF